MFAEKSVSQSMKLFSSSLVSATAVAIDFRRVIVMMENCYRSGKQWKMCDKASRNVMKSGSKKESLFLGLHAPSPQPSTTQTPHIKMLLTSFQHDTCQT